MARRFFFALLALLVGTAPLSAQVRTGTVTGRVVDVASQQPLVGATVMIAERGALTNSEGRFAVTGVTPGSQKLRVVMIGYRDVEQSINVIAGQGLNVDVAMNAQAVELAQLVVVGYGTQRAGVVTGSVTQVSADEFNTGRIVSAEQLIQSKVPGVQVIDNNEPGGGISVRVRGATSINASSEPLYVIDGVPVGGRDGTGGGVGIRNPLNFLNPGDIESVTVLKDAASASIYGANAANGVVMITTRRGGRGAQLEYTGSVSGSQVTKLPEMLNAAQFRSAVQQYATQNVDQLGTANTDWFDQITRAGVGQDHNVALSSAGENSDYRISLGYLNQDGVIKGSTTQRLSAGINYTHRLFDNHLRLQAHLKGARTEDDLTPGGVLSNAASFGPTQPVLDAAARNGYYEYPGNKLQSPDNPVAILNLAKDGGPQYRSLGNITAEYRFPFMEALKATVNLGYDVTRGDRSSFTPGSLHRQQVQGFSGVQWRTEGNQQNGLFEGYLNYAAPLQVLPGNLDLTGGYSYNQSHYESNWWQLQNLTTDLLNGDGTPGAQTVQTNLWREDSRLISFFGRATYNLFDKYILGASVRHDGSSRFGDANAWGTFPSFSAAWRISQEPFLRQNTTISDLKLRGSWAKVGNQAIGNYRQYSSYTPGDGQTQALFGNTWVSTIRPSAADRNIKWEETTSYNIGLDFGFANNRFTGAVDVYRKDTDGLLFEIPVAAGTNLSNFVTTNIGSMKNNGVEATLSAKLLQGGKDGLNWSADVNASHNSNELVEINPFGGQSQRILVGGIGGGVGSTIQVLTKGEPINSFYVYKHKMVNGKPVSSDKNEDMYEDLNNDGKITLDDRRPFHKPDPDWMIGHSSYLSWSNFDASYTMRAYLGNYTYNNVASQYGTYSELSRGAPFNLHASVLETQFMQQQLHSDYYIEDASFLRLDNITVGYSFTYQNQPVRLFGSVQNAFTITGYSGVDPTAGLNGIDNNIYPRSRTFVGGLNVRF